MIRIYALQTPSPEVTLSPLEQFARINAGLISLAVLITAVLTLVAPIYLNIRKERKAKKDHKAAPKIIWLRRVWFWATDKWKRLGTPLEGRVELRTQLAEAQVENDELRQERDDWAVDREATRDRLLKAQDAVRGTQVERQSALGKLDVARYELQEEEIKNVRLGQDLGVVTKERDELKATLRGAETLIKKLRTKVDASQIDLTAAREERDDLRKQKTLLDSIIDDLGQEQMEYKATIKDLTSQLQQKSEESLAPAPVVFRAPDMDPEWFITSNKDGLRLQNLRGDMVRHVYVKAALDGVAVTGGRMDPMFEGSELKFDVRPRYAHLGFDGTGFWVHWTDAKGKKHSAFLEAHVEDEVPF